MVQQIVLDSLTHFGGSRPARLNTGVALDQRLQLHFRLTAARHWMVSRQRGCSTDSNRGCWQDGYAKELLQNMQWRMQASQRTW